MTGSAQSLNLLQALCFGALGCIQVWLEGAFFCRAVQAQKVDIRIRLLYLLLVSALEGLQAFIQPRHVLSTAFLAVEIGLLLGLGFLLRKAVAASLLAATVTKTVAYLSNGLLAPVLFLFAPLLNARTALAGACVGIGGALLALGLLWATYHRINRLFFCGKPFENRYMAVFLFPVLLFLVVELYIFHQVYGNEIVISMSGEIIKPNVDHLQVLLLQAFVYISLFSTLYACKKLQEEFAGRTRIALLEQELKAQHSYLQETRVRYEQTRAFRHDIKNHLLVLKGLLLREETQRAVAYLDKLDITLGALSFPCRTGSMVVDLLLSSKLGVAEQNRIQVECMAAVPPEGGIEELDLCILIANAVDNAIQACKSIESGSRYLRLWGRRQGDFFLLEVVNSCQEGDYQPGTGIANMQAVAEKYHGALYTEKQGGDFYLAALLAFHAI